MALPHFRGLRECHLAKHQEKKWQWDLVEPIVLSLFQVGYGHFHRTLRSRLSALKHNSLCMLCYVKLWLAFFKVDANNPERFLRKLPRVMRGIQKYSVCDEEWVEDSLQ